MATLPTLAIRNANNGQSSVALVTLVDGTQAVAHVTIDGEGNVIVPASDSTVQSLVTAMAGQLTVLQAIAAKTVVLTDAFGGPAATTVTDVFGAPVGTIASS